ncbi:hypothetical protein ELQ92_01460 [Labedella populi]|uniref:DUF7882 domain-containing protein n=1 Tax=Labedella populi TaxID=2498850 RepID=A0A3S4AUY7_9MICO|nr:hypothetical protein [Labedella populi]RWZ67957.1 hypothetical protein ELQ92_01460 [Labedella populi]
MATLTYGPDATTVTIEDRALAHLQYVIFQRYRRHEPFVMTLVTGTGTDRRRRSTWMTPGAAVSFSYDSEASQQLDREWLEELMKQSYSGAGLTYIEGAEASADGESEAVVAAAGKIVDAAAEAAQAAHPARGRQRATVAAA